MRLMLPLFFQHFDFTLKKLFLSRKTVTTQK
jgi:hypothetical protein